MAGLWRWALSRKAGRYRHALRVGAAAGVSFTIASVLRLPQGYWAVITAIVVVQASLGGTVGASRDRMLGTAAGALVGVVAAWLRPPGLAGEIGALTLAVGVLAYAASLRPSLKIAPVTAVIMIAGSATSQRGFLEAAGLRISEIAVGAAIGLACALLIFPARARDAVSTKAQDVLGDLAKLLRLYAGRVKGEESAQALTPLHDKIRAGLTGIESAVSEAGHESSIRLSGPLPAEAIPRTLWRLRSDTVMIGRCTAHGLPAAIAPRLAAPAAAVLEAQAARLGELRAALAERRAPAEPTPDTGLSAFRDAFQTVEAETAPGALSFDQLEQVFGLAYAFSAFDRNIADLADRIAEFAGPAAE